MTTGPPSAHSPTSPHFLTFWLSFSLCLQPLPFGHSTLGAMLSCTWMSGPLKKSFMAGFYTSAKTGSWLQCADSSLIRCSWTLNRNGVYAEAWRGLRLLEEAGVSTPLRTVSSPEDRLWAFQRALGGGRESGRWSWGEDLHCPVRPLPLL